MKENRTEKAYIGIDDFCKGILNPGGVINMRTIVISDGDAPSIGEFLFQLLQAPVSRRLNLEIVGTAIVGEY